MAKQMLLSPTASDFEFQTFCTGGAGGQHRNAKQNGVRCIHPPSGARAEHRDGRDQVRNKREAFEKCVATPAFKAWHRTETMRRMGRLKDVERRVDELMAPENLRVEEL